MAARENLRTNRKQLQAALQEGFRLHAEALKRSVAGFNVAFYSTMPVRFLMRHLGV
jgi:hypothetical protein